MNQPRIVVPAQPRIVVAVQPRIVVVVPVRDEVTRIGDCLRAIALQQDVQASLILLLLNNCRDGTAEAVRALQPSLPVPVEIVEREFAPEQATAGHARALALSLAAQRAGEAGVLMTTDADARVPADWVALNLAGLAGALAGEPGGVELVAGQAEIDPLEAALIPECLHEDDRREVAYGAILDKIHALLDPDPADPWPRHCEESGASLAVTVRAWSRAGGVPPVPLGEDRAFVAALRRVDAPVRHDPRLRVVVSGRIEGRAAGGMAETMRRRIQQQDPAIDDRFETVATCIHRASMRALMRRVRNGLDDAHALAEGLDLTPELVTHALSARYFGAGWLMLEAASPLLRRESVLRVALADETERAVLALARLEGRLEVKEGQGSALDPLGP